MGGERRAAGKSRMGATSVIRRSEVTAQPRFWRRLLAASGGKRRNRRNRRKTKGECAQAEEAERAGFRPRCVTHCAALFPTSLPLMKGRRGEYGRKRENGGRRRRGSSVHCAADKQRLRSSVRLAADRRRSRARLAIVFGPSKVTIKQGRERRRWVEVGESDKGKGKEGHGGGRVATEARVMWMERRRSDLYWMERRRWTT